ncbi:MAG: hypothetical protein M5U28_38125 [Sandaracinaceae bacterium]|nr:hypothetical protein [Sandaracinaceae bacterium]
MLPGDRFLLCTDGVTDVLSPREIGDELSRRRSQARAMVQSAYELGSMDNITAVVVRAR